MVTTLEGPGLRVRERQPEGAPQPLALQAMHDIAGGFVEVHDIQRLLPPASDRGRRQARLVATSAFEAWLVEWPPGAELPAHDHGRSSAVVHVMVGVLAERRMGDGPTGWHNLGPGGTTTVPVGATHGLRNPGPGRAVSVHVYSPPSAAVPLRVNGEA